MVDRTVIDWVQGAFEGDLIGDRQVQVIRAQVSETGCKCWLMTVVTVEAETAWLLWHYPLLQGWLLKPSCGEGGDNSLWVQDDSNECGESHRVAWDLRYHPEPPRNVPLAHILHSRPGIQAGHPAAMSPRCPWPGRPMVGLGSLEEEAHRVPWVLVWNEWSV